MIKVVDTRSDRVRSNAEYEPAEVLRCICSYSVRLARFKYVGLRSECLSPSKP